MDRNNWIVGPFRALHTYLAMLGLIPMAFFAATGLALNHGWFSEPDSQVAQAAFPAELLADPQGSRQAVVHHLRRQFKIAGTLESYECDDQQVRAVFKRPGGRTDAVIDIAEKRLELSRESRGLMGRLNDLHTGAGAGRAWRILIDVTAGLLLFAIVSGVVLWLRLPRRRLIGSIALLAGLATWLGVYLWLVP
jgi:hypothetical protein